MGFSMTSISQKRSTPPYPTKPASFVWLRSFLPLATISLVLLFWQTVVALEIYPEFIIPPPLAVWDAFISALADGSLLKHSWVTLSEMLLGLMLGLSLGAILGYAIAHVRWLESAFSPIIVAFQATPVVAYAPMLVIWFRDGITAKVITTAIIVFFPTLMNVIIGIRGVPGNLRDLMTVLKASPLQIFLKLEIPAALPVLLAGLKTSVTLAVIGAVVGEFVNANEGLGFLVIVARSQYKTPLVLVGVFMMTALALSLYYLVVQLERYLLKWQRRTR
jgi:NitT/TauT family transport system permease protein